MNFVDLGEINKKVNQVEPPWSLLRPVDDLKGPFMYKEWSVKLFLIPHFIGGLLHVETIHMQFILFSDSN